MKQVLLALTGIAAVTAACRGSIGAQTICRPDPITLETSCHTKQGRYEFALPQDPGNVANSMITSSTTEGSLLQSFAAMGGAAAISISAVQSNVGLASSAPVTITLVNGAGQVYASRVFTALRTGTIFRPANPAEVDAWMFANGAAAVDFGFEFGPVPVTSVEGVNQYIIDLRTNDVTVESSGQVWTRPDRVCNSCRWEP